MATTAKSILMSANHLHVKMGLLVLTKSTTIRFALKRNYVSTDFRLTSFFFALLQCNCNNGYTGKNCEIDIDECESSPCQNNGVCLQRSNISLYSSPNRNSLPSIFSGEFSYENASGYECICIPGIVGVNCETNINECESSPCHHGTCHDEVSLIYCFYISRLSFKIISSSYLNSFTISVVNWMKKKCTIGLADHTVWSLSSQICVVFVI